MGRCVQDPRIRSIQHCALAARLPEPGCPRWLRYCDADDAGGMEGGAMADPYSIYNNLIRRRYLVWNRVSLSLSLSPVTCLIKTI